MRLLLAAALLLPLAAAAQPVGSSAPTPEPRDSRAFPALAISTVAVGAGVAATAVVFELDRRGGFSDPAYLVGATVAALAPSAGNLWLGETGDALIGAALRTGGVVAMTYAIDSISPFGASDAKTDVAGLGGLIAYVGGLGFEVVTQVDNGDRVTLRPAPDGLALTVSL